MHWQIQRLYIEFRSIQIPSINENSEVKAFCGWENDIRICTRVFKLPFCLDTYIIWGKSHTRLKNQLFQ